MEFNFLISESLQLDAQGFGIVDAQRLTQPKYRSLNFTHRNTNLMSSEEKLGQIIDKMGELSTIAQGLRGIITSFSRLLASNHRIYLIGKENKVFGFIKVGVKTLFYREHSGHINEIKPICVLDFYVHESVQRNGYGKKLFDFMITQEKVQPERMAYDKPSPKLLGFLKKYFKLQNFIPQNNNFIVFDDYFEVINQKNDNSILPKIQQNSNSLKYWQPNLINPDQQSSLSNLRCLNRANYQVQSSPTPQQKSQKMTQFLQNYHNNFQTNYTAKGIITILITNNNLDDPVEFPTNYKKTNLFENTFDIFNQKPRYSEINQSYHNNNQYKFALPKSNIQEKFVSQPQFKDDLDIIQKKIDITEKELFQVQNKIDWITKEQPQLMQQPNRMIRRNLNRELKHINNFYDLTKEEINPKWVAQNKFKQNQNYTLQKMLTQQ